MKKKSHEPKPTKISPFANQKNEEVNHIVRLWRELQHTEHPESEVKEIKPKKKIITKIPKRKKKTK